MQILDDDDHRAVSTQRLHQPKERPLQPSRRRRSGAAARPALPARARGRRAHPSHCRRHPAAIPTARASEEHQRSADTAHPRRRTRRRARSPPPQHPANSATNRVLPIPASPVTKTFTGGPRTRRGRRRRARSLGGTTDQNRARDPSRHTDIFHLIVITASWSCRPRGRIRQARPAGRMWSGMLRSSARAFELARPQRANERRVTFVGAGHDIRRRVGVSPPELPR